MIPNYYVHTSDKWLVFPHEVLARCLFETPYFYRYNVKLRHVLVSAAT
jgi:hypothetical protein